MKRSFFNRIILFIAGATFLMGLLQTIAARQIMTAMGIESLDASVWLFRWGSLLIAGLGAMLLHHEWARSREPVVPLWTAVQKLSGSGLMVAGFSRLHLPDTVLVAIGYDGLCGLLLLWYTVSLVKNENKLKENPKKKAA